MFDNRGQRVQKVSVDSDFKGSDESPRSFDFAFKPNFVDKWLCDTEEQSLKSIDHALKLDGGVKRIDKRFTNGFRT